MILAGLAYRDVGQPRFFLFPGNTGTVVSGSMRGASPACPWVAGTTAFGNRTRSQPRQRGCSRGLGCYPNKQRNRHLAATPDVCFEHLWEQMHCLPSSATALANISSNHLFPAASSMLRSGATAFEKQPPVYYRCFYYGILACFL